MISILKINMMFQFIIIFSFNIIFLNFSNAVRYNGMGSVRRAPGVPRKNPKFLLYTKKNSNQPQQLSWENPQYNRATNFDSTNPTKFIIHGFMDSIKITGWTQTMKNELLKKADFNVIIVDWSSLNGQPYTQAVVNARIVGRIIDSLIRSLQVFY